MHHPERMALTTEHVARQQLLLVATRVQLEPGTFLLDKNPLNNMVPLPAIRQVVSAFANRVSRFAIPAM